MTTRSPRLRAGLGAALALLLLADAAAPEVLVLRKDGTGDFSTLNDATAAAQDGDVLLLQDDFPGEVAALSGKGLTVVGDGATRRLLGGVVVSNLVAGQRALLRNLEVGPSAVGAFLGGSLTVSACDGAVVVEDCLVTGAAGFNTDAPDGVAAVRVVDAHAVIVARSTLVGGAGVDANDDDFIFAIEHAGDGGPALRLVEAAAHVWSSTLTGGSGGAELFDADGAGDGGAGVSGTSARLWIEGSAAAGGAGGTGCPSPAAGCAGGAGVDLALDDVLLVRDSSFAGGAGGPLEQGAGETGLPGPDVLGSPTPFPGAATQVVEATPVRSGEPGSLTVLGPPDALVAYVFSAGFDVQLLGGVKGVLVTDPPLFGPFLLGAIPPSGALTFAFTVPGLEGFGLDELELGKQALVLDADGLRLSGPSLLVHLGDLP